MSQDEFPNLGIVSVIHKLLIRFCEWCVFKCTHNHYTIVHIIDMSTFTHLTNSIPGRYPTTRTVPSELPVIVLNELLIAYVVVFT